MFKTCRICKKEKGLSFFSKDKTKIDGYDNKCKACHKDYKRQWQRDTPNKQKQYHVRYYLKNRPPGYAFECYLRQGRAALNKIRRREKNINRQRKALNQINAITKQCSKCGKVKLKAEFEKKYKGERSLDGYRAQCKQCRAKYFKTLRPKRNRQARIERATGTGWHGSERARDVQRANSQRRLERKKKLEPTINNQAFKELKERFNNKCFKCRTTNDLTFDHHYPLSLGFYLCDVNAVLLCRSCNSSKGQRPPEKFYSRKELNKLKKIYGIGYGARNKDARGGQAVLFM